MADDQNNPTRPGTKKAALPSGKKAVLPTGTKPSGPPGTKKPSLPPGTKKPTLPTGTKPAGPPGAKKAAPPSGTKKPSLPPGTKKPTLPIGKKPAGPPGVKKAAPPPGTKKPALPPGTKKPALPTGTKPAGPPGAKKATLPSGTKKPTLPPGTKKPAIPTGAKPAGPPGTKKPSLPTGAQPAGPGGTKKPTLPPRKAAPAAGSKPAGPPGKKPARPPKPGGPKRPPSAKPARPPGAKAPSLPPKPGGPKRPPGKPARPPGRLVPDPGGDGAPALTKKDFASDADVRWCPGCGDYAVLAAVQRVLPDLVERKENTVFISGIGCSSRFPYYMNTYGMHSIHGRAPTVATGLKCANPELDVWIITGDGDALSIGGNHFIHLVRRNLDVQVLLFNNQIYGLTKGQYSPTSEAGKVTKSTPYGSLDEPFNPVSLALGADASFVARTLDRDPKHMQAMLREAHGHAGTGFVEVYQNCNIFNDGAFLRYTERATKPQTTLFLEDGQPLVYDGGTKGLWLDGLTLVPVDLAAGEWSADDCLVYDSGNRTLAGLMSRLFWEEDRPQPFGVFYREERPTYEHLLRAQQEAVIEERGPGDLHALLRSGETWTIE